MRSRADTKAVRAVSRVFKIPEDSDHFVVQRNDPNSPASTTTSPPLTPTNLRSRNNSPPPKSPPPVGRLSGKISAPGCTAKW